MALRSGGGGGGSGGIRAGAAFVELFARNNLKKGLDQAAADVKAFGARLAGVGAALVGVGATAAAGLFAATVPLNDLAKQGAVADALGLTAEQFTGIAGVAKSAGEDAREFVESLVTLGKLGTDAANGTKEAAQAFAGLGLNAEQFIRLRADEQFFKVFESLNKVADPLQRTRLLMQAFGEDGGKFLLPLLGKAPADLRKMAAGFAVSTADMKAATGASQAYAAAAAGVGRAWDAVGVAVAPVVRLIADGVAAAATEFKAFVDANRDLAIGLTLAAGGVTAVGVGLLLLGPAVAAVGTAWTALTGVVSVGLGVLGLVKTVVLTPILAIPAALVAAGVAWATMTEGGRAALGGLGASLKEVFGPALANVSESWSVVVKAITRGDLEGAMKVAFATVNVEWQRLCIGMRRLWGEMLDGMDQQFQEFAKTDIGGALDMMGRGMEKEAVGLAAGVEAWGMAIDGLQDLFQKGDPLKRADEFLDKQMEMAKVMAQMEADANAPRAALIAGGAKGARNPLQQAQDELTAARTVTSLRGAAGDWGRWLKSGWDELGRLVQPAGDALGGHAAARATYGGNASLGFFGGAATPFKGLEDKAGQTNKLLEKINQTLLDRLGVVTAPNGEMVFVGRAK